MVDGSNFSEDSIIFADALLSSALTRIIARVGWVAAATEFGSLDAKRAILCFVSLFQPTLDFVEYMSAGL